MALRCVGWASGRWADCLEGRLQRCDVVVVVGVIMELQARPPRTITGPCTAPGLQQFAGWSFGGLLKSSSRRRLLTEDNPRCHQPQGQTGVAGYRVADDKCRP
jgi:hypothetical protein